MCAINIDRPRRCVVGSPHITVRSKRGRDMEASANTLRRFDASQGPRLIPPDGGKAVDLGLLGVRFMAWTEETGEGFSLVEHPIPPRHLAGPVHRHSRE